MAQWEVTFKATAEASVFVEADSKDEASIKAYEKFDSNLKNPAIATWLFSGSPQKIRMKRIPS